MELKGYYLDGKTAERKDAVVWVEITGLAIDLPGGARLSWPYGEIRQNRDFSDPGQIRLEKGGPYSRDACGSQRGVFYRPKKGLSRTSPAVS